jgi:hypothetical protein
MLFRKLAHLLHYFGLPVDEDVVSYIDTNQLDDLSLGKTFLQPLDAFCCTGMATSFTQVCTFTWAASSCSSIPG